MLHIQSLHGVKDSEGVPRRVLERFVKGKGE